MPLSTKKIIYYTKLNQLLNQKWKKKLLIHISMDSIKLFQIKR
jgi:hypothetical protein